MIEKIDSLNNQLLAKHTEILRTKDGHSNSEKYLKEQLNQANQQLSSISLELQKSK